MREYSEEQGGSEATTRPASLTLSINYLHMRSLPLPPASPPSRTTQPKQLAGGKMWFLFIYDEEQKELRRQRAPGSCPYCSGKVEAVDVEIQWRLCFLPMCFKIKRKYFCTLCSKRLELFY